MDRQADEHMCLPDQQARAVALQLCWMGSSKEEPGHQAFCSPSLSPALSIMLASLARPEVAVAGAAVAAFLAVLTVADSHHPDRRKGHPPSTASAVGCRREATTVGA